MRMRNVMVLVGCMLASWVCLATNVKWNDIECWTNSEGGTQTFFKEFNGMYALFVQVFVGDIAGGGFKIDISCQHWVTAQNWFLANKGDTVDGSTTRFRSEGEYLLRHEMGDGANIDAGTFFVDDTSIYLAFVCSDTPYGTSYPPFVYGWIELGVDKEGSVSIHSSAYDLDGGPMVVGGGAYTGGIPEPSGWVLMLLGLATLGLRRRHDACMARTFRGIEVMTQ